jgi:hypothetical protein
MSAPTTGPVLVITYREKNEKTGKMEEAIDHGVDLSTGKIVILEQTIVQMAGYVRRDPDLGWVLR